MLEAWRSGDPGAGDQLLPLIYAELRKIAGGYLSVERQNHTLQPTALVHEAYLRLIGQHHCPWQSRSHFFAIAAKMIRRILIDHARHHQRAKRGAGWEQVPLAEVGDLAAEQPAQLLLLDSALRRLQAVDPMQASIVEYRFFGGLTGAETAEVAGCSEATVKRRWRVAKAWLFREMTRA